ncbi:MAG: pentapeptide repeat-containing protein [Candidatus Competibacteraceae bacterium]
MNCEFSADWRWLDLTGAKIDDACRKQLGGKDFSGAKLAYVDLSLSDPQAGVDLTKTQWNTADLTGATFTGAILDGADFTGAMLIAANLTYIQAKGTIFTGAQLKADQINGKPGATADFAHLEDVKFDSADLSYASFGYVTLTGPKVVLGKATLTGSHWENANLSGVDLTGLTALGADFSGTNLANTSLKNTNLAYNAFKATGTTTLTPAELVKAYFCGATLDATVLTCADLTNAYSLNASQTVTGPDGQQTTCDATIITTDPNGQYTTKTEGVANKCNTICPDGSTGPCKIQAQWQFRNTGPKVCCVRKRGDPPCPPVKKAGKPCTSDCDCHSKKCSNGVCADDATLIEALRLKRTGRLP